ncbi:hypothetical protein TrCOL_g12292, partial [Triparma columacea]
ERLQEGGDASAAAAAAAAASDSATSAATASASAVPPDSESRQEGSHSSDNKIVPPRKHAKNAVLSDEGRRAVHQAASILPNSNEPEPEPELKEIEGYKFTDTLITTESAEVGEELGTELKRLGLLSSTSEFDLYSRDHIIDNQVFHSSYYLTDSIHDPMVQYPFADLNEVKKYLEENCFSNAVKGMNIHEEFTLNLSDETCEKTKFVRENLTRELT